MNELQFAKTSDNVQENVRENADVQENVLDNVQEKDRRKIILDLLRKDNTISIREIAEKLQMATKTIQRDFDKLKVKNIIRRVGADKGGHWEIIADNGE